MRLHVTKVELERLLSVMYPTCVAYLFLQIPRWVSLYFYFRAGNPPTLSRNEWESVLKLSTAWNLETLRALAMDSMLKCSIGSVTKVRLGGAYNVPKWIREACQELVQRPDPISEEEGTRLGSVVLSRICRMREEAIKGGKKKLTAAPRLWSSTQLHDYDCTQDIEKYFSRELEEAARPVASIKSAVAMDLTSTDMDAPYLQSLPRSERFYMDHVIFRVRIWHAWGEQLI